MGLKGLKSEGVLRYGVLRCRKTRSKGLALFMFEKALPSCESSDTQILHISEGSIRTCASANDQMIAAKGRLETIEAGNRRDDKKKNQAENERNGVGFSRGAEGGPGRIVIGVTCIRRGPQMTIKRWGRCMSSPKVHSYPSSISFS